MALQKQYEVVRDFRRTDRRTGDESSFKVGDVYSGSVEVYDLDPAGPDNKGPLLADKSADKPVTAPPVSAPSATAPSVSTASPASAPTKEK